MRLGKFRSLGYHGTTVDNKGGIQTPVSDSDTASTDQGGAAGNRHTGISKSWRPHGKRKKTGKKIKSEQNPKIKLPSPRHPRDATVSQDEGRSLGWGETVRDVPICPGNLGEGVPRRSVDSWGWKGQRAVITPKVRALTGVMHGQTRTTPIPPPDVTLAPTVDPTGLLKVGKRIKTSQLL